MCNVLLPTADNLKVTWRKITANDKCHYITKASAVDCIPLRILSLIIKKASRPFSVMAQ